MQRISDRYLLIELAVAFVLLAGTFALPQNASAAFGQAGGSGSAIATTQLTDTVYHADGTTATGTVLISWPAFTTSVGQAVPSGNTSVTIVTGGLVSLTLVPNAGSNPMGSYYTAVYHLDDGTVSREYWVVPVSSTPVTIASIKSTVLPASVAVQTVTKSYVDSAIAAAVDSQGNGSQLNPAYVLVAGDTMTGPLVLPADPVSASQAADKHYVDTSVAAVGGGSSGKVALTPSTSQVVAQPTGTALSVNRLNGVEYASQYTTGGQANGIANAAASTDCAAGCEVKTDESYATTELLYPTHWNSETHVEDTREGGRWDSYLNPEHVETPGVESGQAIDVTSTRSGAVLHQLTGTQDPASISLALSNEAPVGGSNLFPQSIDGTPPYFKSAYSALGITGTYNTQGQHVLVPRTTNCYGVGDCLIGSEFIYSSGGFRDEADEGAHPMDIQSPRTRTSLTAPAPRAARPDRPSSASLPLPARAPRATAVFSSTRTPRRSCRPDRSSAARRELRTPTQPSAAPAFLSAPSSQRRRRSSRRPRTSPLEASPLPSQRRASHPAMRSTPRRPRHPRELPALWIRPTPPSPATTRLPATPP